MSTQKKTHILYQDGTLCGFGWLNPLFTAPGERPTCKRCLRHKEVAASPRPGDRVLNAAVERRFLGTVVSVIVGTSHRLAIVWDGTLTKSYQDGEKCCLGLVDEDNLSFDGGHMFHLIRWGNPECDDGLEAATEDLAWAARSRLPICEDCQEPATGVGPDGLPRCETHGEAT